MDGQGRVYVLDSYRHDPPADPATGAVQVFDADGRFLAEWGAYGTEPGQLRGPFGIGLDPDGTLLIAEFDNNRVQRFTPEGELLDGWGEYGIADGQFIWAMDAAVDAAGRVFVTDYANHRVQVFDRDGRFLAAWGEYGTDAGEFTPPSAWRWAATAPSTSPTRASACRRSAWARYRWPDGDAGRGRHAERVASRASPAAGAASGSRCPPIQPGRNVRPSVRA